MGTKINKTTSDWQTSETSPLFTLAPNIFCPLAFLSHLLHWICDTTSSALTLLSMDAMTSGGGAAAVTDLVALVDAVDELRVRGCPGKTDGCRVDRLGLHVARGDGGYWDEWGEEEKKRQKWRRKAIKVAKSQLLLWCHNRSLLHRSGQMLPSLSFWWHLQLIPKLSVGLFVSAAYGLEGDVTPLCGPYQVELNVMEPTLRTRSKWHNWKETWYLISNSAHLPAESTLWLYGWKCPGLPHCRQPLQSHS